MNLLESIWQGYERAVVPADAGDAQRFDTRQAFYAGGLAVFSYLTGPVTALSEDQACAVLSRLQAEFEQNAAMLTKLNGGRTQ